jgi:hypothetical protein
MLVSSFHLSQSFNYAPYLFCKKTVQIRDKLFLNTDLALRVRQLLEDGGVGVGGKEYWGGCVLYV